MRFEVLPLVSLKNEAIWDVMVYSIFLKTNIIH